MRPWILVVILTFREVTVIDVNSEYLGVQVETLMENAGYAVANAIIKEYGMGKRIAVIYGIGIHGEIKEPYYSLISKMNQSGIPIVSIDVPSGLGTNMAVRPVTTITLHDIKEGMNQSNSGRIEVVEIGIPKDAERFDGPGEYVYYPIPKPDSHKGVNGRLLVIGGGPYTLS